MTAPDSVADAAADSAAEGAGNADARWIARAIELATRNVANGGGPFGALIVKNGELVAEGENRVTATLDPSAHAEIVAIRAACQAAGDFSLAGATLYASCEPCPLCMCAALWARVDRVVYAADRDDAARAGFDDRAFYDLFTRDRSTWPLVIDTLCPANSRDPFAAWVALEGRVEY